MGNHDRIAMGKIPIFMGSTTGNPYAGPMKLSGVSYQKRIKKHDERKPDREKEGIRLVSNNPFLNYLREYRKTHDGQATRIVADAAKRWNRMTKTEKERFRLRSKKKIETPGRRMRGRSVKGVTKRRRSMRRGGGASRRRRPVRRRSSAVAKRRSGKVSRRRRSKRKRKTQSKSQTEIDAAGRRRSGRRRKKVQVARSSSGSSTRRRRSRRSRGRDRDDDSEAGGSSRSPRSGRRRKSSGGRKKRRRSRDREENRMNSPSQKRDDEMSVETIEPPKEYNQKDNILSKEPKLSKSFIEH